MTEKEKTRLCKAAEELHMQEKDYRKADNRRFLVSLLYVVLAAFALRQFIGLPFLVQGSSMDPTLKDGERMLIEKVSYYLHRPERYDIIVCDYPGAKESRVKRVIGFPGEVVQVDRGVVLINGAPLDERAYWDDEILRDMEPHIVEEGSIFVMGDNRNFSKDSRDPTVGDIPFEKVDGRAVCIIWPFDKMRGL